MACPCTVYRIEADGTEVSSLQGSLPAELLLIHAILSVQDALQSEME